MLASAFGRMMVAWASLAIGAAAQSAAAQTIDASYNAKVAGLSVGQARVSGTVAAASYQVSITGRYGLLGFSGTFEAGASGAVANGGRILPANYRATNAGRQTRTTTLAFAGGNAVEARIEPAFAPEEEGSRVPLDQSHRRGVVDPVSGLVAQVLRASLSDDPCAGLVRVFSGFTRFDVSVTSGNGGPAGERTCRASYRPIAGHRTDRPAALAGREVTIVYPARRGEGQARLPSRIEVPLTIGTLVIEQQG